MTPELKQKWLDALRSGKYKQGQGTLHSEEKYCCLGVLCEVAGYEWNRISGEDLNFNCLAGENCIDNCFEREKMGLSNDIHSQCFHMNDGTNKNSIHSFLEIADWLEAHL